MDLIHPAVPPATLEPLNSIPMPLSERELRPQTHEASSPGQEPSSPHDFVGGIMRITPEVNVRPYAGTLENVLPVCGLFLCAS